MRDNILRARDVEKTYGVGAARFQALRGVSLDIRHGEAVAIVGKSGSGKSTLMRLLALHDSPNAGAITVEGVDAKDRPPKVLNRLRNEMFGFVFQQFFMIPNATVLDNAVLPLKIAGMPGRERAARGKEVLEQVELADKARVRSTTRSGGQRQRMVIARALANRPKVIFADEPTGNLDSATGEVVTELLFTLNQHQGMTLVIVTHDEDLATRCERRIAIKDGLIAQEAAPATAVLA